MEEEKNTLEIKEMSERAEVIGNQYLHDLYRFFKLHSRKAEFRDPFNETISLHRLPLLKEILCQPEHLTSVAEFYFRKERYPEAIEAIEELSELLPGEMTLFQKTGYCLQKEKRYAEAIEAYLKADMIKPDNGWTNRHLATCYRMLHSFANALNYYHKVEAIQTGNGNTDFYIGTCLAGLERYDEALNYFFKLDMQENSSPKTGRAIAWCSLMAGKNEQAMKYYGKLIDDAPTVADYLNAGHTAWITGNPKQAIELYRNSLLLCKEKKQFWELFECDKPILIKLGIPSDDIPLMLDIL
jgi:tetratricopeptide (TPR) repeat protein